MRKSVIVVAVLALIIVSFAQGSNMKVSAASKGDVKIDISNFPDGKFRADVSKYDLNYDGYLSQAEIKLVTEIECNDAEQDDNYRSLKGIEHFTSLKKLWCSYTGVETLDLRKLVRLESVRIQYNYSLTSIQFGKNKKLKEIICKSNSLTALSFKNLQSLEILDCGYNKLKSLNIENCKKLSQIECGGNEISSLSIKNNNNLTYLGCGDNKLKTLNLDNNPSLEVVDCHGNNLSTLHVEKAKKLKVLNCMDNKIKTIKTNKTARVFCDKSVKVSPSRLVSIKKAKTGDEVRFGNYNGNTDWIVLEKKDGKLLLLCKNTINRMSIQIDTDYWGESDLRKWLNNDYYEKSFSGSEKKKILTTVLESKDTSYGPYGSKDGKKYKSEDKVFLLSQEEVLKYFGKETGRIAVSNHDDSYVFTSWYLRSPFACSVNEHGEIKETFWALGDAFIHDDLRPAIWVKP